MSNYKVFFFQKMAARGFMINYQGMRRHEIIEGVTFSNDDVMMTMKDFAKILEGG